MRENEADHRGGRRAHRGARATRRSACAARSRARPGWASARKCYGMDLSRGHARRARASRSASSPRSRSASPARSSRCARSTSAARPAALVEESRAQGQARRARSQFSNLKVVEQRERRVRRAQPQRRDHASSTTEGREIDRYVDPDRRRHAGRRRRCRSRPATCCAAGTRTTSRSSRSSRGRIRFEDLVEGKTMKIERDARRRHRAQAGHRAQGRPAPAARARGQQRASPGALPDPREGLHRGRGRREDQAGRRCSRRPPREIDRHAGHHRRSAARHRAVRGAPARRIRRSWPRSTASSSWARSKRGKRTIIVRALGPKGEVIEEHEHAVPQGKHLRVHKGDEVRAGDPLVDGPLVPARHPAHQRRRGPAGLPAARDPERLPLAGRHDRRQAHRDHHRADDAQGAGRATRATREFLPGAVVDKFRFRKENERLRKERQQAGDRADRCCSASPRLRSRPSPSSRPRASRRRRRSSRRPRIAGRATTWSASRRT